MMIRIGGLPLLIVCLLTIALWTACSEKSPVDNKASGPCPGESGFGARLAGQAGQAVAGDQVDICVPDDSVRTVFNSLGRYDVTARMTGDDGTIYEFQMVFPHRSSARALNLTGNFAEALADPDGAWFYYRDTPDGDSGVESIAVIAGTFHLGYSDTKVVAGMFSHVELEVETVNSDRGAGTRTIVEGFFSILTDEIQSSATN
jgi:hypothetical protein